MKFYYLTTGLYGYELLPCLYVGYKIGGKWWQVERVQVTLLKFRIEIVFAA